MTPLHLSVISGNSRVVRALLIKGSNRDIADNNNKKPIELAQDNEYSNLVKILKKDRSLGEYCNVKPSYRP